MRKNDTGVKLLIALYIIVMLALMGGTIYVLQHFIIKYW